MIKLKIAIIGDSISEGIGSKKINYCKILESQFKDFQFKNFSLTGTTIKYALQQKDNILHYNPEVLIVCYGQVEALTRPKDNTIAYRLAPSRYKRLGMMDPRALYTSKSLKKLVQKFDSNIRYNFKKLLIRNLGYVQWVGIEEFEELYMKFIESVSKNIKYVILLSTVNINDHYFPYCTNEFQKYNKVIEKIALEKNLSYINIYNQLSHYEFDEVFLHDHFHPNSQGYEVISRSIAEKINKLGS